MTTSTIEFTERQKREKEYYDEYVSKYDLNRDIDLSPVLFQEQRPWNSYWALYHLAGKNHQEGARLLDFGSGPGDNALRFSHLGYQIEGFDISDSNVEVSRRLFKKYNKPTAANFQVAPAEALPYPDKHFNMIAGIDILHHVDIPLALGECHRVLKAGGIAVFREPIEVPFLDWVRNLTVVKWVAPKEKSFELHITEDEKKLNDQDLIQIQKVFPNTRIERFFLLARFDKFFRQGSDPSSSYLERIDFWLMKNIPFLDRLGGVVLITLRKD